MVVLPTVKELNGLLQEHIGGIKALEDEFSHLCKQQAVLHKKHEEIATKLRTEKRNALKTREQIIACSTVPRRVVRFRKKYLEASTAAQSEGILIREKDRLDCKAREMFYAIQDTCAHPFVFSYDGHLEESLSYTETLGCKGARICQICGLKERSREYNDDYIILIPGDDRLIKRDLRNFAECGWDDRPWHVLCEFLPLSVIKNVFFNSAGDENIAWPEK